MTTISRRDALAAMGVALLPLRLRKPLMPSAAWLLLPMDDAQAEHLKAYGVTYRAIGRGVKAECLVPHRPQPLGVAEAGEPEEARQVALGLHPVLQESF